MIELSRTRTQMVQVAESAGEDVHGRGWRHCGESRWLLRPMVAIADPVCGHAWGVAIPGPEGLVKLTAWPARRLNAFLLLLPMRRPSC